VTSPVTLVVTAFATCQDVRGTLTPALVAGGSAGGGSAGGSGHSVLVLVDLGAGRNRLGGSVLGATLGVFGGAVPDLDDPARLTGLVDAVTELRRRDLVRAYHDRSDGGLWATVCEMAFAGSTGVALDLPVDGSLDAAGRRAALVRALFAEELGVVLQVPAESVAEVMAAFAAYGLGDCAQVVGRPSTVRTVAVSVGGEAVLAADLRDLHQAWDEVSWRIARLRDNPECADEEHAAVGAGEPGLQVALTFDPGVDVAAPYLGGRARPKAAILREQGVNSHSETAFAFDRAGFDTFDVHMTDLQRGRTDLRDYQALVACGGFSYGDTLGAGEGWARSVLFNPALAEQFSAFFHRPDTLALGICNGAQMLAALAELIPGTSAWPRFTRNRSEQFEGRLSLVEVLDSPSIFLTEMAGSRIPIVVSHGEGYADFSVRGDAAAVHRAVRFVDGRGEVATAYPANPNGSPDGLTGVTTPDGRFTVLMPHPERVARNVQMSWTDGDLGEPSPWLRMFANARAWVG
jgi:phosphoribosylformylglycinamidine synthase